MTTGHVRQDRKSTIQLLLCNDSVRFQIQKEVEGFHHCHRDHYRGHHRNLGNNLPATWIHATRSSVGRIAHPRLLRFHLFLLLVLMGMLDSAMRRCLTPLAIFTRNTIHGRNQLMDAKTFVGLLVRSPRRGHRSRWRMLRGRPGSLIVGLVVVALVGWLVWLVVGVGGKAKKKTGIPNDVRNWHPVVGFQGRQSLTMGSWGLEMWAKIIPGRRQNELCLISCLGQKIPVFLALQWLIALQGREEAW